MEGINNIVYIYGIIHVAYVIMLYNLQYFFLSLNDSTASLYCTNGFISEPVYGCGFGGRDHRIWLRVESILFLCKYNLKNLLLLVIIIINFSIIK